MSSSNSCFLTYKQVSQESGKLVWYSHLLKNFPQFFSDPQFFCDPHSLLWFVDLTFQVPMQYCSLQHRTWLPSPVTSTTGHCFHFGSIFSLFLISPLFFSSILGTYRPGELVFQCPIFLLFHIVHGVLKARILKACHALLQWTTLCQTSPPWPACLGLPHRHGLVSLS